MSAALWFPGLADGAVGVLLAAAVVLATGSVPVRGRGSLRPTTPVHRALRALGRMVRPAAERLRGGRSRRRGETGRVQVVITQVAGLVRSGMPPDLAWASVDIGTTADGMPRADDLVGLTHDSSQAHAVVAACRLAHEIGSPVAPVLDSIVSTLVTAAESAADREAALAAPRSTARLLLWLPVVGAGLATVLGASPLRLLLDGGPAALAPVAGGLMLVLGQAWSRRLVRSAAAGRDDR